ncbi:MAG: serine/threonine-protein kinase [Planctomycetota bacterium]
MTDPSTDDHIDRLTDALGAFLDRRGDASGESDDAFLARHGHLRDLLEPMLDPPEDIARAPGERPRFLGDYRVVREIGRGGMGVVYEAQQLSIPRRVALKVLPPHFTLSARRIERFRREAAAAGRLRHPGLVQIYEVGESAGTHFFAMEFVEGKSLAHVLCEVVERGGGPADVDLGVAGGGAYLTQVAEVVAQIAETLAFAHENGIVHRDVKPQNVLIASDRRVRVVDFGLAKDVDLGSLSRSGEFAGTPHYVSPEQASGRASVDHRSDVFSLGVVMYQLLTLDLPFDGESTQQVLLAVGTEEPRAPRQVNRAVPVDLETVCLKAIAKDPGRRYQTAAEMAADLRRFLRGEAILARPVGFVERSVRFARRHRAASAAAGLALILLLAAPLAAIYYKRLSDALIAQQQATARQRDLAKRHLDRARRTVDLWFSRFAEAELREVPGMEQLRRAFCEDALQLYEELVAGAGDDRSLERDLARAFVRLGCIRAELGNDDRAVLDFDDGVTRLRVLTVAHPDDVGLRFDLADAHRQRSMALRRRGRDDESAADHAAAVAILQRLAEPDSPHWQRAAAELAKTEQRRAEIDARVFGGIERALQAMDHAVDAWLRLGADRVGDPQESDLAFAYLTRGRLAVKTARWAAAERDLSAACAILRRLMSGPRSSTIHGEHLCHSLAGLAEVYGRTGRGTELGAVLAEMVDGWRRLANDFPHIVRHRASLAWALMKVGTRETFSRPELARPLLEEGLQLAETLVREYPDNREFRLTLGRTLNAWGLCLRHSGGTADEIDTAFERACATLRQVLAADARELECHAQLGAALSNLAEWRLFGPHRDLEECRRLIEDAIPHQRFAHEGNPRNVGYQGYLLVHYRLLGEVQARKGEHEGLAATAACHRAVAAGRPVDLVVSARLLARAASLARDAGVEAAAWHRHVQQAIAALDEATAAGLGDPGALTAAEFDVLRDDPAFDELRRRVDGAANR